MAHLAIENFNKSYGKYKQKIAFNVWYKFLEVLRNKLS